MRSRGDDERVGLEFGEIRHGGAVPRKTLTPEAISRSLKAVHEHGIQILMRRQGGDIGQPAEAGPFSKGLPDAPVRRRQSAACIPAGPPPTMTTCLETAAGVRDTCLRSRCGDSRRRRRPCARAAGPRNPSLQPTHGMTASSRFAASLLGRSGSAMSAAP